MRGLCRVLALLVVVLFVSSVAAGAEVLGAARRPHGLLVVVTFPGLLDDVKMLACPGDRVVSLVPRGVDPHDYYLPPWGLRVLRAADVIVSLGHTPLELMIRRMWAEGLIGGVLVEVPRVPGVRLLRNPVTGSLDLHMPVYDPRNYAAFIEYLAHVLALRRPECRGYYLSEAGVLASEAMRLYWSAPRLSARAVADSPALLYAVSWLGVRVVGLLRPGYGLPVTPAVIEDLAKSGVSLVVVTAPVESPASTWLRWFAEERGLPVLYVYSPTYPGSVIWKLRVLVDEAVGVAAG